MAENGPGSEYPPVDLRGNRGGSGVAGSALSAVAGAKGRVSGSRLGIPVKSALNLPFACLTYNALLPMVLRSFGLG